jgi:hypothetical protein
MDGVSNKVRTDSLRGILGVFLELLRKNPVCCRTAASPLWPSEPLAHLDKGVRWDFQGKSE